MSRHEESIWHEANQRYMAASIAALQARLDHEPLDEVHEVLRQAQEEMPGTPALETISQLFDLSSFERDILLLCAGVELSSDFAHRIAEVSGSAAGSHGLPTFGLALAISSEAHWSALIPAAPLRYWRLIDVEPGAALTTSPLRIDERILHYLSGVTYLDQRLEGMAAGVPPASPSDLPASQQEVARQIAWSWHASQTDVAGGAVIQLTGSDLQAHSEIAGAACGMCGLGLYVVRASDVPPETREREALVRLWEREARLTTCALLIDWDEPVNAHAALSFVDGLAERVIVAAREPISLSRRPSRQLQVEKPSADEQQVLWESALDGLHRDADEAIGSVVRQFNLTAPAIRRAGTEVAQDLARDPAGSVTRAVWGVSRRRSRARLDDLAQRLDTRMDWNDLVLPERELKILREIAMHVRQRTKVYVDWGFAEKSTRGLGLSALFAGASGTGKTLTAEVLANALRLDLYRIDLSAVVSKYIGETEKNLRRIFDAAEDCGAILLFDEADALFGKRSEVRDSHDRYANIEVSYLLQRMELYGGLAILTTNMKDALDTAFLRRLRFIVHFPFPDAEQRARIWGRAFPQKMPQQGLELDRLAQLHVSGGHIRNIAMYAAFLAAEQGGSVRMEHLLQAAGTEYAKVEKSLTEAETRGWSVT